MSKVYCAAVRVLVQHVIVLHCLYKADDVFPNGNRVSYDARCHCRTVCQQKLLMALFGFNSLFFFYVCMCLCVSPVCWLMQTNVYLSTNCTCTFFTLINTILNYFKLFFLHHEFRYTYTFNNNTCLALWKKDNVVEIWNCQFSITNISKI